MAVRTRDEILASIRGYIGETPDDRGIAFIEDFTDTMNDYESRISGGDDWKRKYEENDREWRQKYTDRFFSQDILESDLPPMSPGLIDDEKDEEKEPETYDDLFMEVE